MQSNTLSLTKKLRSMFHASPSGSQPVPIYSSEPIGGGKLSDVKDTLHFSVAGLLLQVLTMRDEVKQNKEEWGVVMRKLGRVAGLVVNVGESCQKYNLEENDLPPGLRSILQSLQNELGGIESLLKQSAEMGHIRKALLRKDLLRKVKQYDGELSNVLQTFQAELALDARFEQIAERRKGIPAGPSGHQISSRRSIPQEPRSPQIFFGRDAELAEILHMILTGIRGSRPARIAILGPGGYGKTTLANAALTHPQVQEQFGGARYFVACESVFSSGALLVELAKTLGILDGGSDASWSHIHARVGSKDSIICLDNFESPWDQAGDMRILLRNYSQSHSTQLCHLTHHHARHHAARPDSRNLEEIGQNYDDAAEELIKAVDYVPLAVSLLAHLAQATSPTLLLKEWNQSQTKFIQMGQTHRLSNLEYSIQLSIDSGRMRANPPAKDLLGILSMLPDGIHTEQLGRFKEILVDMDILSNLCTLQQCSLVHEVISSKYKDSLQNFYINLASSNSSEAQPKLDEAEASYREALKFHKIANSVLGQANDHWTWGHIFEASRLVEAEASYREALKFHKIANDVLGQANDHKGLGDIFLRLSRLDEAEASYREALKFHKIANDVLGQGNDHKGLGDIFLRLSRLDEAEASYREALKFHKIANSVLGQGNDHKGLGDIFLRLSRLDEAEASYREALEFHKIANSVLGQANDYLGLGDIFLSLSRPDEAEASYREAMKFHKIANSVLGQGDDHKGLGDMYLSLSRLDEAEASYREALEFHKVASDVLGQGTDLHGLGKVHMERSQLEDARGMFEKALAMHKKAYAPVWQGLDQKHLNIVLSKMDKATQE
ncbi:hypothetical protein B0F90DRAFT_1928941 [Multifurca ochricompacta]|uniref:TPR-like protein n=1 Tax=Multifurca ochricompacta TaxID=376703 RepID=A0AAD4LVP2_9AGAM|nr:hypothetical protein B0F90DRAFT_1928941 [Multifurca ochricompacta]